MLLKMKVNKPFITIIHSDYKLDFKDNVYKRFVYTTINEIALKCFDYYLVFTNRESVKEAVDNLLFIKLLKNIFAIDNGGISGGKNIRKKTNNNPLIAWCSFCTII